MLKIKKNKIKRSFYPWAMASLVCMIAIFWFSSQSADESGELSGAVTRIFAVDLLGIVFSEVFIELLEVIVRKAAHFVIYAMLSFCTAYTVRQLTDKRRYIFLVSVSWCSFYAMTDELHQHFVPGRACMWQDWVIDTVGTLLGVCVAFIIMRLVEARKKDI